MEMSQDTLLTAYSRMRVIRAFEERLHEIALQENPFGFAHLYAGAEACAVGVMLHLEPTMRDVVTCAHRPHGQVIAKGGDLAALAKEIFGRAGGSGGGKGGTMHVSDWKVGMHGASGIIGASTPHALGAAFTAKSKKTGGVAVAFGGDGAANQGAVFESLNLAKVLELPVVFVLEDNGYAEATSKTYSCAGDFLDRVAGFGIPTESVDGVDFFAVFEAAGKAIERARGGRGPSFIRADVPLFFAHFEGDQETYRAAGEVAELRERRDCLKHFGERVIGAGTVTAADLDRIGGEAEAEAHGAIAAAQAAPAPLPEALFTDVYGTY
jgi:pyruvate dehydrogenase E1 component alpha subunit